MKKNRFIWSISCWMLSLAACQQHKESKTSEPDLTGKVAETSQITDCEIKKWEMSLLPNPSMAQIHV